jgi:UDP-N-acetylmuramoyl-L-alanyl-D-glutamate--2,6-diaminopimelate ligase
VRFASVAFTNLSQDHLDYHETMEAYGNEKAKLFREGSPAARVLNIDDAFGRNLAAEFPEGLSISAAGAPADISAVQPSFRRDGLSAQVSVFGSKIGLSSPLLGRHNLENLLVAWGLLHTLGVAPTDAAGALGKAAGVPGRLERCDGPRDDIVVVVDYAHTPDALTRALATLSELAFEEVVCVFGCGGDRDRAKRPLMGKAAAEGADRVYLTSDNPRSEDPMSILRDVRPGLAEMKAPAVEEVDRRLAIEQAVTSAAPGAVVLIAGKGHEDYQLIGDQVLPFDDRVEARRALALRMQLRGISGDEP